MNDFKGRHLEGQIILWAVCWYCKYGVSTRELEALLDLGGVGAASICHEAVKQLVFGVSGGPQ